MTAVIRDSLRHARVPGVAGSAAPGHWGQGGHNVDAILQLQADAGHMLLHLEPSSSLSCNT